MRIANDVYTGGRNRAGLSGSGSPYALGGDALNGTAIGIMSSRMFDQLAPKKSNAAAMVQGKSVNVAQTVKTKSKPAVMSSYAKGPVGFLQWLAAVHPQLYDGIRKKHPELLVQAHDITAQMNASLSGLGDWTDAIGSWVSSATNVIGNLANAYSTVKQAQAGPQIQQQLVQAQNAQPPVAYGNAPSIPPGGTAVTSATSGFGNMGMMIGVGAIVVVGGLAMFSRK